MDAGLVVTILIIGGLIRLNISERNYEKWSKEQDIKRKKEQEEKYSKELNHELEYINSAFYLLPNVDEAINKLVKKYQAKTILQSIFLSVSDVKLLMQFDADKWTSVDLPNMQSENYGAREKTALNQARNTIKNRRPFASENDFIEEIMTYGIDSVIEEPTVGRLYELQQYVDFKKSLNNGENIKCKLTSDGDALVIFYLKLCSREDRNLISFPKPEATKEINRFVKTVIELLKSNN